jgi:superoxide reductase
MKFYICKHCKNIIAYVKSAGVDVVCCGAKMEELVPNTVEASSEKHLPVVEVKGNEVIVKVGSVAHPTLPEHHIEWIAIECLEGNARKLIKVGSEAVAHFALAKGDKVIAVYEYCNLHGLWKTTL